MEQLAVLKGAAKGAEIAKKRLQKVAGNSAKMLDLVNFLHHTCGSEN